MGSDATMICRCFARTLTDIKLLVFIRFPSSKAVDVLSNALLQIQKLSPKYALGSKRKVKALEQVFLFINKGETLGSVEKSGSGKSTLARIIRGGWESTDDFSGFLCVIGFSYDDEGQCCWEFILHGVKKQSEIESAVNCIFWFVMSRYRHWIFLSKVKFSIRSPYAGAVQICCRKVQNKKTQLKKISPGHFATAVGSKKRSCKLSVIV